MSGSPQLFKTDTENAFFSPSRFIYSENDCEIIIPISWRLGTDGNRLGEASPDIAWMQFHCQIT